MPTLTCRHLTYIPPCSSPTRLGLWILLLGDRSGTEEGRMVHFLAAGRRTGGLRTQNELPDWQADGAVARGQGVEMFGEFPFAAQKISISGNTRGQMVICHRKSGYTIAEETIGERLTLYDCAQLHRFLEEARPPTHCTQEDTPS